MDAAAWQRLSPLLDEALELPAAARGAWLDALARRDPALAAQLGPMLNDAADPVAPVLARAMQALPEAPQAPDLAGRRLGAWTLRRKIGEGGMGQVWLAERSDGLYEARAAIKLLRADLLAGAGLAERFARERAVLARLQHPGIARLLDAGVADGQAYLVLEHVAGLGLAEHVRQHQPDVAGRVRLVLAIAEAVDHAHAQLVVHRDLKPSNVMVTPEGTPKLLDFGIAGWLGDDAAGSAQLTRLTGSRLTLAYAAPEQVLGEPVGVAADVFSLGVVLYELLGGGLPFAGRGARRTAAEHALLHHEARRLEPPTGAPDPDAPPPPADARRVRGDLQAVVAKALRKAPAERYGSMRAFIDDLQRWLTHRPVSVRRDDWRHRTGLWLRRHALVAGAVGGVLLALGAGLGASVWQWRRAEAAAQTSDSVTRYLGELLASASPDRHGGQVPTVVQLLEASRQDLPQRFAAEPDTQERLLEVLATTYREMNRWDRLIPLAEQRLALLRGHVGAEHPRTLRAQLALAEAFVSQGSVDKVVALLEPMQALVPQRFGEGSPEQRRLLRALAIGYSRTGRATQARELISLARTLTDASLPPAHIDRLMMLNDVQVVATNGGRFSEGLAALKQTEPHWATLPRQHHRFGLVMRRNLLAVRVRMGDYAGVPEQAAALVAEADALLGPGNDMAAGLHAEMARVAQETGRYAEADAQRQAVVQRAAAAAVQHPALALPPRAHALLARALARPAEAADAVAQARALLGELARQAAQVGSPRHEARLSLARLGVVAGDTALATEALAALRADAGPALARNDVLASRVAQVDAQLARLQANWPRAVAGLRERVAYFQRTAEPQTPPAWAAALDLAASQLLAGDAAAARVSLALASRWRPPAVPQGVPLDRVAAWLAARLGAGVDDTAPWQALADAVGRSPQAPVGVVLAAALL